MIPASKTDFTSKHYWTTFFKHNTSGHFEWYLEVNQLLPIVLKESSSLEIVKSRICIPGNGDSLLASSLATQGFTVDALDFDPGVVKRMSQENKLTNLSYLEQDITQLHYEEPQYDLVVDKGSLDALYSDETPENRIKAQKYLRGAISGIKHRGRFIIVSLLQPHILDLILDFFSDLSQCCFISRLYQVIEEEQKQEESKEKEEKSDLTKFIKFVFVFEVYNSADLAKVSSLFGSKTTFQTLLPSGEFSKPTIYPNKEVLRAIVLKRQELGLALNRIKRFNPHQEISIKISSPSQSQTEQPLYDLTIVDIGDSAVLKKKSALITLVPVGMEKDESFSTTAGRKEFVNQCGFSRVIFVKICIGFKAILDPKAVQQDLKDVISDLIPIDCVNSSNLPFTTVPSQHGKRELLGEVGEYKIYEYMNDDQEVFRECVYRGLIIGQSRVVRKGKQKSKKQKELWEMAKHLTTSSPFLEKDKNHSIYISPYHLRCSYPRAALISLLHFADSLSQPQTTINVLVVGMQGGPQLSTFLATNFQNVKVVILSESAQQLELAQKYFSFTTTEHHLHFTSLPELVKSTSGLRFNFIIFEQNPSYLKNSDSIIKQFCDKETLLLKPVEQDTSSQFEFSLKINLVQDSALLCSHNKINLKPTSILKELLAESVYNELKFYQSVE